MTFSAEAIMSSMKNRHSRETGSDINRLVFDEGTQFRAQCLFGNQIDRNTKQVFQVEHNAEIALRGRRAVESNQDVDVAGFTRNITRGGTEQGEPRYTVTRGQ